MSDTQKSYAIAILRNVFMPDIQGMRSVRFVSDEQYQTEYYDTFDEAKEKLEELDNDIYCTCNNEAGRPEYVIVDEDVADYIQSGRNSDGGNYDWDGCDCTRNNGDCCGECQTCLDHMIDDDIAYIQNNQALE